MRRIIVITMLCVSLAFSGCSDGKVDLVQQKISEIGVVTLESEGQIEEVRALYDQLTDKQKNKVENVDVLEEAQKQYAELKEEEEKRIAEEERIKKAEEMVNQGIELIYSDKNQALSLFKEAADAGNEDAMFLAGYILFDDSDERPKAKEYLEAVANENPYAKICLSYIYGDEEDIEAANATASEALKMIDEDSAENTKYPSTAYMLNALLYRDGKGTDQNYTKALELFEKSAELKNPAGMANIAFIYEEGHGVEKDQAKACEWYEKSAELGFPYAMNQIGLRYQRGAGVEQDYEKAMEWYIKAAELGQPNAHNQIGWMYREGLGVEQDYVKAMEWFEKAADLGNNSGMNNIGVMYDWGYGVEKDVEKACEWYKKSAELGNAYAMYNLAGKYYGGVGVKKDLAKAKEWCEKAAELGHEEAKETLATVFR